MPPKVIKRSSCVSSPREESSRSPPAVSTLPESCIPNDNEAIWGWDRRVVVSVSFGGERTPLPPATENSPEDPRSCLRIAVLSASANPHDAASTTSSGVEDSSSCVTAAAATATTTTATTIATAVHPLTHNGRVLLACNVILLRGISIMGEEGKAAAPAPFFVLALGTAAAGALSGQGVYQLLSLRVLRSPSHTSTSYAIDLRVVSSGVLKKTSCDSLFAAVIVARYPAAMVPALAILAAVPNSPRERNAAESPLCPIGISSDEVAAFADSTSSCGHVDEAVYSLVLDSEDSDYPLVWMISQGSARTKKKYPDLVLVPQRQLEVDISSRRRTARDDASSTPLSSTVVSEHPALRGASSMRRAPATATTADGQIEPDDDDAMHFANSADGQIEPDDGDAMHFANSAALMVINPFCRPPAASINRAACEGLHRRWKITALAGGWLASLPIGEGFRYGQPMVNVWQLFGPVTGRILDVPARDRMVSAVQRAVVFDTAAPSTSESVGRSAVARRRRQIETSAATAGGGAPRRPREYLLLDYGESIRDFWDLTAGTRLRWPSDDVIVAFQAMGALPATFNVASELLLEAAQDQDVNFATTLLRDGHASVRCCRQGGTGETALHIAVALKDFDMIRLLVRQPGYDESIEGGYPGNRLSIRALAQRIGGGVVEALGTPVGKTAMSTSSAAYGWTEEEGEAALLPLHHPSRKECFSRLMKAIRESNVNVLLTMLPTLKGMDVVRIDDESECNSALGTALAACWASPSLSREQIDSDADLRRWCLFTSDRPLVVVEEDGSLVPLRPKKSASRRRKRGSDDDVSSLQFSRAKSAAVVLGMLFSVLENEDQIATAASINMQPGGGFGAGGARLTLSTALGQHGPTWAEELLDAKFPSFSRHAGRAVERGNLNELRAVIRAAACPSYDTIAAAASSSPPVTSLPP